MAVDSVYDWRRNDANDGTSSKFDRLYREEEARVDDGRAGDAPWTCDVEEVGVGLRIGDDPVGDL